MRALLAIAILAVASPALAQQTRVDGKTIGCQDRTTVEQIATGLKHGLTEDSQHELVELVSDLVARGACRVFENGETAQIDSVSAAGMHCLKPRNARSDCYWTPRALLR